MALWSPKENALRWLLELNLFLSSKSNIIRDFLLSQCNEFDFKGSYKFQLTDYEAY